MDDDVVEALASGEPDPRILEDKTRERVALAIRNADAKYRGWPEIKDHFLTDDPIYYLDLASAAIAAIRHKD